MPRYSRDVASGGLGKRVSGFFIWTLAPVLAGAAVSVLGLAIQAFPENADALRSWALGVAIALGVFSATKAIRDFVRERSAEQLRYSAIEELHNKLGPALDLTAELAAIDPAERDARDALLKQIATQCCSALVAMTPAVRDVRAVIYQLNALEPMVGSWLGPNRYTELNTLNAHHRGVINGTEITLDTARGRERFLAEGFGNGHNGFVLIRERTFANLR